MVNIENNFRGNNIRRNCICGQVEDMKHIYLCKIYSTEKEKIEYENIFWEDIRKIRKVYQIFRTNYEMREQKMKNYNPRILSGVDPLYSDHTVMEINWLIDWLNFCSRRSRGEFTYISWWPWDISPWDSLGNQEISHREISHGHQEI